MIRRTAIACVALVALMGATEAVAKKKKPKVPVGPYVGMTIPDGVQLTVTLDAGRATGSVSYCGMTAPFTTSGSVSAKSFTVNYTDPVTMDTISATGFFSAKRRSVTGTLAPNGCDATPQTYAINK